MQTYVVVLALTGCLSQKFTTTDGSAADDSPSQTRPTGPSSSETAPTGVGPSETGPTADTATTVEGCEIVDVLGLVCPIPAGTFTMGSPGVSGGTTTTGTTLGADPDEGPAHQVTLSEFWIMEREVTQAMWEAAGFPPVKDAGHPGCPTCPIENVHHVDALEFAAAVSVLLGETYVLPTEAQWEYAAKGGVETVYAGSDSADDVGWYSGNTTETHPGCEKAPNGYALCDMSGNVIEWVNDWYAPYTADPQVDPTGPAAGTQPVYRNGAYNLGITKLRVQERYRGASAFTRGPNIGFRLARADAD
jgi:formylglycine-generating enzyme required for sulfatase activity